MLALHRNDSAASKASHPVAEGGTPLHFDYHALLDVLPVGIFLLGPDQCIRSVNPAAVDLLGVTPEEAVGQRCNDVLQCSFCGPACAAVAAREDGKVRQGFPCQIQTAGRKARSLLIDAVPVGSEFVAVLLRDVTEGERLRRALKERWVFHGLVCVSGAMKEIVDRIRDVAPYDSTVLILGESGTGKEVIARALHAESRRATQSFVAVNCSAYSENLLESELFGHVRGSFTGAERDRRGRFEQADGGTVFLDEIAEISPKLQVKLLRVLQEREIERVGESRTRPVDLRVIAATNRDLQREMREGRFREDLYYRLKVFSVSLPPLRDRKEDIAALTDHFLERLMERTGKKVEGFSPDVMDVLMTHAWPGNVRELENVVESALVRARGRRIVVADLPDDFRAEMGAPMNPEQRMRAALERAAGCVTRAARLLGVHRTTLWRRMREAGLRRDDFLP